MTKDEALDKALNALLWANIEINDWRHDAHGYKPEDQPQIMEAITAIKQARSAQQEHEPENEPFVSLASVQEPVACDCNQGQVCHVCDPITPPAAQRQWVGLAEADKHKPDMGKYVYLNDDWLDGYKTGMEYAEAKLKEKNT